MATQEFTLQNMNVKTFIDYIITFNNVNDILESYKSQSEKGY
jgi:hypothetical protein